MVTTATALASCLVMSLMPISLTVGGAQFPYPGLSPPCKAEIDADLTTNPEFNYLPGNVSACMALLKKGDFNLTTLYISCNASDADTYTDDLRPRCEADVPQVGKEFLKLPAKCTATIDTCLETGLTIKGLLGEGKYCEAMSYSTAQEDTSICLTGYPFSNCTVTEYTTLKDAACSPNSASTFHLSLMTSFCCFLLSVFKMAA